MIENPTILVVNDDGINAKGIRSLIEVAKEFGNILVVAPDGPRSGMSHAITLNTPLRIKKVAEYDNVIEYVSNGTPVDCVKLAQKVILNRYPDLVLSGINHGSNSAISLLYSGTMAAALEAAFENIPAIGFSLLNYNSEADFDTSKIVARQIIKKVITDGIDEHTCLNVNIPDVKISDLKGFKITTQAKGYWKEEIIQQKDPHGRHYYWLTGEFFNQDTAQNTDMWALENNYVSIQPVQFDLTSYSLLDRISHWEDSLKV